jgi:hypothetical protein
MEISATARIARPVADVWRWYAVEHIQNHPRWDPEMQLEQVTPGPIGPGTRIRRRSTRWGEPVEGEMEIKEWVPERVMGAHVRDANMEIFGRASFESQPLGETVLTLSVDIPGLDEARAQVVRTGMSRTVTNIKRLVEAEVRATATR